MGPIHRPALRILVEQGPPSASRPVDTQDRLNDAAQPAHPHLAPGRPPAGRPPPLRLQRSAELATDTITGSLLARIITLSI